MVLDLVDHLAVVSLMCSMASMQGMALGGCFLFLQEANWEEFHLEVQVVVEGLYELEVQKFCFQEEVEVEVQVYF